MIPVRCGGCGEIDCRECQAALEKFYYYLIGWPFDFENPLLRFPFLAIAFCVSVVVVTGVMILGAIEMLFTLLTKQQS
jgi:hypothetical protein